ncbi:lmo0937 family membrane protein [Polynucleobacter sp. 39-46-10]|nr:lmo0937 family membrane protein [Polynucleobacter sp. 39-46-10]
MIEIIAIVMLLLWLTGIITSNTLGGFIHLLLVVAVVMFLVKIIQG